MGFKLGRERGIQVDNGEIKNKMSFNKDDVSIPGVPVFRKDLGEGIMGEANMDGSIYLSNDIEPGSAQEREVLMHEMKHMTDMRTGKLSYEDDYIKWNGQKYDRLNGFINFEGNWLPEGDSSFPWEKMY